MDHEHSWKNDTASLQRCACGATKNIKSDPISICLPQQAVDQDQDDYLYRFRNEFKELIENLGTDDLHVLRDEVKRIMDEKRESRDDVVLSFTKDELAMVKTALSIYISDYSAWIGTGIEPYKEMLRYMESIKEGMIDDEK